MKEMHTYVPNKSCKLLHSIFGITYAGICTRIIHVVSPNEKQIFQLFCALQNLLKDLFFSLIHSVLFEKQLCSVLECKFLSAVMAPHVNQSRREKTRLKVITQKILLLLRETSLDPNGALVIEKLPFRCGCECKLW